MMYVSTRDKSKKVTAAKAIAQGLAPDGGLFVPETIPAVSKAQLGDLCAMDYRARAVAIMEQYLEDFSREELIHYVTAAYGDNFDDKLIAPVKFLDDATGVLELYHGPTCAFKDMALQILPYLLTASLKKCGEERQVCILVATSGDTGKAALEGFADVKGTKIVVFYPRDGVSDVQKLQMTSQSGGNVFVSAVSGNFDDAQTGVKTIFGDADFAAKLTERGWFLSSANSINWGRLLPQIVYYFSAYCDFVNAGKLKLGDAMNFVVPTGNFGDILAGWYAKQMGLPVKTLVCASNANNVLTDFIRTGAYNKNRPFYTTTSPSMDILVSSNLERLLYCLSGDDKLVASYMEQLKTSGGYTVTEPLRQAVAKEFYAGCCDDARTADTIREVFQTQNYLMDTHTGVAWSVLEDYRKETGDKTPTAVLSTASPFKFCDSVLRALGEQTDAPGTVLLERLTEKTGVPAPSPLAALKIKTARFNGCVEKHAMMGVVDEFVK
ncbi:MAG: threonine synthase [Oscillospiraceae bacterium]|jgi:threonine synthase|nr:threonine synthase [Oscillospiraceae bacterium]